MRRLIPLLLIALSSCTHTNNWMHELEDQELQHIEGYTGHTMSGFAYYQKVEKARIERKRLHQEFLKSIK